MSTLAEDCTPTPAAAVTAASASHVPTAASPSAVLQLSYEAAVSHPATAAPSDTDATGSSSSSGSSGASAISGSAVQLDADAVAAYERILAAQGDCGVRPFFLNKYETEAVKNWDRCGTKRHTGQGNNGGAIDACVRPDEAPRLWLRRGSLCSLAGSGWLLHSPPTAQILQEECGSILQRSALFEVTTAQWAHIIAAQIVPAWHVRLTRSPVDLLSLSAHSNEFKELGDLLAAERRERGEPEPEAGAAASPDDGDEGDAGTAASPGSAASASASASPPAPLLPITEPTSVAVAGQRRLLEVGCGVGNAMFPLLRVHPSLFVYGVDCSKNAIQCVQNHPDYAQSARCAAWVVDLVADELPPAIGLGQLDFATLVFVLSAIHPTKMGDVLRKVHAALKQNEGVLFVRD